MSLRLPVLVERIVAEARATQTQTAQDFDQRSQQDTRSISCRSGCANCCHHPFLVTVLEGLLLYRWLADHGQWTPSLKKRVTETRDKTLGLAFEVWLLSNLPCPLLRENKCIAYDARPLHCRITYSEGLPSDCHPHALSPETPLLPNIEVIVGFNSRLRMLLKKLDVVGSLMPLSEALLLGEAIEKGTISIEDSDFQHARDLVR